MVIVIFVICQIVSSPTVLLSDVLQHVNVEGGVEGDVGNQLQGLLAHHGLLKKRFEDGCKDGNDDVEDEEGGDGVVGEVEEPEEVEEREWRSPCGLSTRQYLHIWICKDSRNTRRRSPSQIEIGAPDPTVTRPRRETLRQIARTLSNMKHETHHGVKDRKTKWKTMVAICSSFIRRKI